MSKPEKKPAEPKLKCRTCGGRCGKKKGQSCRHGANAAKKWSDELFAACIGGVK